MQMKKCQACAVISVCRRIFTVCVKSKAFRYIVFSFISDLILIFVLFLLSFLFSLLLKCARIATSSHRLLMKEQQNPKMLEKCVI